ncbi:MAG: tetratricopeptide repeat protein [Chryseolinea sp.]
MEQSEIDALLEKAYAQRGNDIHGSIALTEQALQKSIHSNYENGKGKAENQLGLFHLVQGNFDRAGSFAESALAYFEKHKNLKGIADAYYNLGSICYRTDNYHNGLLLMLDCLKIYRLLNDFHNQARVLKSLGTIYEYFGDYDSASESYEKCIDISKTIKDPNLESNAYNPLSGIYLKRNEIDKAFEIIQKSIEIKNQTQDLRGLAFALYARGKVYIRKKEFEKSVEDFQNALTLTRNPDDKLGQCMVYNKLGVVHFQMKDFVNTRKYLLEAVAMSKKFNISFVLFKSYRHLYELAKVENKTDEALTYLEQSIKLRETVITTETHKIIKSYDAILKIEALEHEALLQKEKNDIIEKKNAELDSFFYRVSHDLKGPISSLLGLHNLVQMDIQDKPALHLFDMYNSQALRMNNIVMGLINLTEIKNTEELKSKIDFERLVDECVNSCHYLDQSSHIAIRKEIESIEFISEWAIINTILQNLIENAIKYSRREIEPFVAIKIFTDVNFIVIRVEDNGQGIPEKYKNNIFDMFFRANDRTQGSGLGLYILKRAVERLRGNIEVESTLHIGSIFTVKLPVHS